MAVLNTDITYYTAFNDFGARIGIGTETVSDRRELIDNIVRGEGGFDNVVQVLAFNASEGWSIDATDDVLADVEAEKLRRRDVEDFPLSRFAQAAE